MALQQPEQSYFPRARLRLIVRFDEFASKDTPDSPQKPPHYRKGKGIDPSIKKMQVNQDPQTGAWYVGEPPSGSSFGTTSEQTKSSDNRTFKVDGIVPVRCTVLLNGVRQADTMQAAIRWLDFPVDPKVIRSCAVEAYLGTVSADDYARQMTGGNSSSGSGSPPRVSTLPDTYTDKFGRPRTNLRFQGFVDKFGNSFSKDGHPLVTLECTDLTALLLDTDAPPKLTVSTKDPIDKAVADYLANFPQCRGFKVTYVPIGADPPTLDKALAKTAFKPSLGPAPGGGAGGGAGGQSKFSVMDYLTDVCGALGLLCRVQGTSVLIQRPRTLYASKFSGRFDDPFTGRTLPDGRVLNNRLFVWGKNIEELSDERKLRKPSTHNNVEVRCFSAKKGKTLVGRFPGTSKDDRQKKLVPGNQADEAWKVITVYGIEDEATLRAIAQAAAEQVGRNELTVRFQTNNLASFGGDNGDPDALDMQSGDPIDVEFERVSDSDAAQIANLVGVTKYQLVARPTAFLRDLGFDADFAAAYGTAVGKLGLSTTYRVKTLSLDWTDDWDGGGDESSLTLDVEAMNFVEVRQSKDLPPGEEVEPVGAGAPTPVQVVVQNDASGGTGGS